MIMLRMEIRGMAKINMMVMTAMMVAIVLVLRWC